MHRIFLSYSFQNEHQPLLIAARTIIECAGFRVVDGKVLDGPVVLDGVRRKIKACRGVVCVVTPEAEASGWVTAEFFQAVGGGKDLVSLLCHEDVNLGNAFQGVAVLRFSDGEELTAITQLAATLGMWRQSLGNSVRAVLLPEQVGLEAHQQNAKCEYRCEEMYDFEESDWHPARLKPIDAAIHAILPEVPLNHSLQVRVTFNNTIWTSEFMPQHVTLELKQ